MKFRLSHKPGGLEEIRALEDLAKKRGLEQRYADALKQIVRHLLTHPLEWGDPEYHLKHEGAVVCHRIVDLLVVRFAVYEIEEVVHIFEIKPVSSSPIGSP